MFGIDILSPGRFLTIPFLAEQTWLWARAGKLHATEVFDFLIRADDDSPLDSFIICLPSFCRRQLKSGGWQDTVSLLPMGDAGTQWGWFYIGAERRAYDHLALAVPSLMKSTPSDLLELEGLCPPAAELRWHEELKNDAAVAIMQRARTSIYRVVVGDSLEQKGNAPRWFRLLAEPVELDIAQPFVGINQSVADLLLPTLNVNAVATCSGAVRDATYSRLRRELDISPDSPALFQVEAVFKKELCARAATSTRVIEHRIMLGSDSVAVSVQPSTSPSLRYIGPLSFSVTLPLFGRGPNAPLRQFHTIVYNAVGGAVTCPQNDLEAVARGIVSEARFGSPKTKETVATSVVPQLFREACVLIDKMQKVGLLGVDYSGRMHVPTLSDSEFAASLRDLRKEYLDETAFSTFPAAREAFSDEHPFRLDFTCSWAVQPFLQRILACATIVLTLIALVISIMALILSL